MEELQLLNEEQTRNELASNAEQLAGKLETCQEMMKTRVPRTNSPQCMFVTLGDRKS